MEPRSYTVQLGNREQPPFIPSGGLAVSRARAIEIAQHYMEQAQGVDKYAEILNEKGEVAIFYGPSDKGFQEFDKERIRRSWDQKPEADEMTFVADRDDLLDMMIVAYRDYLFDSGENDSAFRFIRNGLAGGSEYLSVQLKEIDQELFDNLFYLQSKVEELRKEHGFNSAESVASRR